MADYVYNKKAKFNFELKKSFEAGLELFGHEVKSVKAKRGSLDGAHVTIRGGEAFLIGATIEPYQPKNTAEDYEPMRNRRLLLNKKEIIELEKIENTKGLTIVPVSLYNKGKSIKAQIAVGQGKKKFDKRQTIKKRDQERDLGRRLK
jgi:SsrA-binding protein